MHSLLPQPSTDHVAAREFARINVPEAFVEAGTAQFRAAWERFAHFGLYRLTIPEAPLATEAALDTLEGLGEGTGNAGFLLAVGAHSFAVGASISRFGSDAQRRLLGPMIDGSAIASFAASEPDAGSASCRSKHVASQSAATMCSTEVSTS